MLGIVLRSLYEFPVAAVTDDHKLSGLKQRNFLILEFWRAEVQNQPHWANIKVWAGCVPSGGLKGEWISWPFPASRDACIPWLVAPSSTFKAGNGWLSPHDAISLILMPPSLPYLRTLVMTLGPLGSSGIISPCRDP